MSAEKSKPNKVARRYRSVVVDYSYQDFSTVPIRQGAIDGIVASTDCHTKSTKSLSFPAKLHEIMSNPEYEEIIGWLSHGRSWDVKDKDLLVSVVLKNHFSHSNYESFIRQVNIWGFKVWAVDCRPISFVVNSWLKDYLLASPHLPIECSVCIVPDPVISHSKSACWVLFGFVLLPFLASSKPFAFCCAIVQ